MSRTLVCVIEDSRSANSDVSESAAKELELRAEKCAPAVRQCLPEPVRSRAAAGRLVSHVISRRRPTCLWLSGVLACVVRNAGAV